MCTTTAHKPKRIHNKNISSKSSQTTQTISLLFNMDSSSFNTIEFSFESHIPKMLPILDPADDLSKQDSAYIKSDPRHRIVVCQHWLLGLCQVGGSDCTYLHRYDKSMVYGLINFIFIIIILKGKMPQCKHGKSCKIKNCPLKHGDVEVLECIFYRQGFCFNGPNCHRRHIALPPEKCPVESSFEPGYYLSSSSTTTVSNTGQNTNPNKKLRPSQPNENYKVTLCTHWLQTGSCTFDEGCHFAHGNLFL